MFTKFLRALRSGQPLRSPGRSPSHRRPLLVEALEDRVVLNGTWSPPFFAPYTNTLQDPAYSYSNAEQAGVKYIAMGFITADAQNKPAWDGQYELGTGVDTQ